MDPCSLLVQPPLQASQSEEQTQPKYTVLIFKCSSTQAVNMSTQFNKVCNNPLYTMENIILTINRKGSAPFYKLYMHS